MFTKALVAACIVAVSSFAADAENCLSEYYSDCSSVGQCCGQMECWNGGDPWHCQVLCWSKHDCDQYED